MRYKITSNGQPATLMSASATIADGPMAGYNFLISDDYPDENGDIFGVLQAPGGKGRGEHINIKNLTSFRKRFPGDARPQSLEINLESTHSEEDQHLIEKGHGTRHYECGHTSRCRCHHNNLHVNVNDVCPNCQLDLQEKAPPGWKGSVKAMKKHPELSRGKTKDGKEKNPFALAWYMHKKGDKPHYKNSDSSNPKKKKKYKEWLKRRDKSLYNEIFYNEE
ncbi:MAG: hypothetical protein DWQ19_12480 [Crenarchaeota archaeon]|nr:MAG: hypothetical protein DWQ19_12480 [Thermoproteota archaeon]